MNFRLRQCHRDVGFLAKRFGTRLAVASAAEKATEASYHADGFFSVGG